VSSDVDPATRQNRVPDAERDVDRDEPEDDPHEKARDNLGRDHTAAARRDEERGADGPVPELARDRHHADERGEERAGRARGEQQVLVVVASAGPSAQRREPTDPRSLDSRESTP